VGRSVYLSKYEEKILDGEEGLVLQEAYKVIVKVGEILGAERLVPISKAHVSGISYKNIGDHGLDFINTLVKKGGKFRCYTSLNPAAFDLTKWREFRVTKEYYKKQVKIISSLKAMGARTILSCTPYLINPPKKNEQIAWGESNAVLYANSILGARTNREGGPLVIYEAIAGKAPYFGLRRKEERKPELFVDLSKLPKTTHPGIIGFYIGLLLKKGVPYINGFRFRNEYDIRSFLAAIGASSSIGLVLIERLSPELKSYDTLGFEERVSIDMKDITQCMENFQSDDLSNSVIALGCPHLSVVEFRKILNIILNKEISRKLVLFTSRITYNLIKGIIRCLERKNVKVYTDTCMVVSPLFNKDVTIITDSVKAAYYLSSQGYKVHLVSREEAIRLSLVS